MNKLLSISGLIVIGILLLAINLLAGSVLKSSRLDLTENQLYTLSPGTERILSNLEEPVTLRLYFSEKFFTGIPALMSYGQRVRDLLEEYASLSDGKLKLIVADPEPFSETEDQAVQYGLQGVPVDSSGNQAYFGLVGTNSTDDEEVIAFIQPEKEESLEYDMTRMIYKLSNPKQTTVGLISGLQMDGQQANPFMQQGGGEEWFILTQLKENYALENLDSTIEQIPDNVDVLMLVHPKGLTDKALYAIDQFVLNGGRLLAFIDPFSEADQPMTDPSNPMAGMQQPRHSELKKLLDAWGVEIDTNTVVGDRRNAQRVQAQMGRRVQAVDYVAWMTLGPDAMNESDFVTKGLEKISVATAGIINKKADASVEFTPLIQTSDDAAAFSSMQFQFGANPSALLSNYSPGGETFTIAARISGKLKTAFPEGVEGVVIASPVAESVNDANLIIVADADMLEDRHWVTLQNFFGSRIALPRANNDVLVLNALENLSGSNDLISLRSRSKSSRPFEKVQELKQVAEQRFRDKEKALQAKLREAERKLAELQRSQDGGSNMILTPEQKLEIAKFREQQVQTRKELRAVQHELIKSVENLGTVLKVINIAAVPLLVIVFAIIVASIRSRKIKQAAA